LFCKLIFQKQTRHRLISKVKKGVKNKIYPDLAILSQLITKQKCRNKKVFYPLYKVRGWLIAPIGIANFVVEALKLKLASNFHQTLGPIFIGTSIRSLDKAGAWHEVPSTKQKRRASEKLGKGVL
jgi:hypothetical protein